jgi:hypothetical protein
MDQNKQTYFHTQFEPNGSIAVYFKNESFYTVPTVELADRLADVLNDIENFTNPPAQPILIGFDPAKGDDYTAVVTATRTEAGKIKIINVEIGE